MAHGEPRVQHIIPSFYLAGFTRAGAADGTIHVFDYVRGKHYRTSPRKACRQRDYYRVEEPGCDPNATEKLMAWHESVVAPYVQGVARDARASDRRQVGEALALAALLAVRGKRAREQLTTPLMLKLAVGLREGRISRRQWSQLRESEIRNGVSADDLPSFEEAVELVRVREWLPPAPRAALVGLIPQAQDALLRLLVKRHWELLTTDSQRSGGFVCSDSPLVWGNLDAAMLGRRESLADPAVEITFPVSKDAALVSYPEARDANCEAPDHVVAHVNSRTLFLSGGLVFHADMDFLLRGSTGEVCSASEYFGYVARARRRGLMNP